MTDTITLPADAKPKPRRKPPVKAQREVDPDYNDVRSRLAEFAAKFPDGRLRQKSVQFLEFAGSFWVVYTAQAWRDEDDPAPAEGTAWEPVPGKTEFTRDSELQNAETAAWGRAIVAALASDTTKGIASLEEILNRQPEGETP